MNRNDDADALADAGELAYEPLPAQGCWLVAVTCGQPGGEFKVRPVPDASPRTSAGDVLVWIVPQEAGFFVRAEVWTVTAGVLVSVAAWDHLVTQIWPEVVRPAVAFAMDAMSGLTYLVDLGPQVLVPASGGEFGRTTGLPVLDWLRRAKAGE
jgi:hypothetical protein